VRIDLVTLVVADYDPAIAFFTEVLGFELAEDKPSLTNDGRPKRWVVVRPPGAQTGLLLARADGERQEVRSATRPPVGSASSSGRRLRVHYADARPTSSSVKPPHRLYGRSPPPSPAPGAALGPA
jgi:catechol 2,3-dioxygenase-like lactoylglutathione lyase family enzyme